MENKVHGVLKHKCEDFIVEEIGEKWNCKVENSPQKVSFNENENGNQKDFILCEMQKKDIDHFSAIRNLKEKLNLDIRDIGYAGTKDSKALTSQRISLFKPDLEKLKNFKDVNIILKNFKWGKRKIRMGYLDGNHFRITIRDIDPKAAMKISEKIRKTKWFANYFGSQRFGNLRGNNVEIGKLILKKKFKEAIMKILLDISSKERSEVSYARNKLKEEIDFSAAARYFPHYLKLEKQILFYLSRRQDDFIGALKRGERKNILMLIHSVQSKVFNEILQKALEEGLDFTKKGQQNCILAGYKTRFSADRLGEIEREVLEENSLELSDFDLREIPYLRIKGSYRRALVEVKNLKVDIKEDENFKDSKKILLEFSLPSGVYATTFLDEFFEFR